MSGRSALLSGIAIGAVSLFALLAAIGLVVVYTGSYNVAATDRHADVVRWAFETTKHRSVEGRAADIAEPEAVLVERIAAGAKIYASTCFHCHGGPGAERPPWADHMRPKPPHLVEAAAEWDLREIFWVAKNGLKMTGMPAFGGVHDDPALWGVAAFVQRLPGMTPEDYAAATGGEAGHGGGGDQGHAE